MDSLLIFGASRGTGSYLLSYALKLGIDCTVLVRSPEIATTLQTKGAKVVIGDACCAEDVNSVMEVAGSKATIICTLGGTKANYEAQRQIIDCAEQQGFSQMLLVTSLGCGNTWPRLSDRAKKAFGHAVREKTLAEQWLQTSQLAYCILRPGGLVDGEPLSTAQCYSSEQEVHGMVHRSDLALIILSQLEQPLQNTVYSVVDPNLKMSS